MTSRIAAVAAMAICAATAAAEVRAEPPCTPSVALDGDDGGELERLLSQRGLIINNPTACAEILVAVERSGDGRITVRLDSEASTDQRTVVDAAAAATVIESWARTDLAAPLLAVRTVEIASRAPPPPPEVRVVSVAPRPVSVRHLEIAVGSELGVGVDGSTWSGMTIAGCVNVVAVCVGVVVRAAIDNRTSGDSRRLEASRFAIDSLLTLDVPIRRARWSLYPGLGVGQGAQKTIRDIDGDGDELAGVRLRAHVGVGVRLGHDVSLLLNPEIVWTPGNPKIVSDPDEGPEPFIYPGDPGLHFRLGVGLLLEAL